MGGQETLLLLARHPRLLAGAAAFDPVTDFALQYRKFPSLALQSSVPQERGRCRSAGSSSGSRTRRSAAAPGVAPQAYLSRSPITYVRGDRGVVRAAAALVEPARPDRDRPAAADGRFYDELIAANPKAPVYGFVGFWKHSAEMRAKTRLPLALATFGLLAAEFESHGSTITVKVPPSGWCERPAH